MASDDLRRPVIDELLYHTPPEVCSQKFATLIGREKICLCNREEKCALTDVVYSTGDFMRQCKNVCKTRSLIYA